MFQYKSVLYNFCFFYTNYNHTKILYWCTVLKVWFLFGHTLYILNTTKMYVTVYTYPQNFPKIKLY